MGIDRSVVEKAAGLARIALAPEEVERFTGQLSVVLQAVERLKVLTVNRRFRPGAVQVRQAWVAQVRVAAGESPRWASSRAS